MDAALSDDAAQTGRNKAVYQDKIHLGFGELSETTMKVLTLRHL